MAEQFQACSKCAWVQPFDDGVNYPSCARCGRVGTVFDIPLKLAAEMLINVHHAMVANEQEKWIKWTGKAPERKGQYLLTTDHRYQVGMYHETHGWLCGGFSILNVRYYRPMPPWPAEPPMDLAKLPKVSAHRARMDQSGQKKGQ